ncbi:MAG: DNA topoisomerase [Lachnospiraceae bacterium]|nr:DNA topoisomerase [Lachnospiraceae bacterium]
MGKYLFIAEKPSVAQEFAKTLKVNGARRNGFVESDRYVVTWCVGHLVTMSYPDKYDPKLKRWSMDTLPFLPEEFRYEIIPSVKDQFKVVDSLLRREDIERIYVCTDSGREGEYIYRLVEMMSDPAVKTKDRRRVWIDSFTEEEIMRGIREAKPISAYDQLSDSAFLRAKEDYLMGINFSRLLTLRYGDSIAGYLNERYAVISVGRVMTCVLGMVVRREREIRAFVKQPFYRVLGNFSGLEGEWKATAGSRYFGSPKLYKDNGFRERKDAEELIARLNNVTPPEAQVVSVSRKKEKKNPPMLYNLAELQNDCSRFFKISPDQTLQIAQELYEKKLTTYPRTDARVLSSAVAKVISGNLKGLTRYEPAAAFAGEILEGDAWKKIGNTRYTNDKAITDHYAIIPTGSGLGALNSLSETAKKVYLAIVRRFLSIFYPAAEYQKTSVETIIGEEHFFSNFKVRVNDGYLKVLGVSAENENTTEEEDSAVAGGFDPASLKKGMKLSVNGFAIKEGATSPPKRYTSGSMILAMENAGQLIEDESLREEIKGSGIGTSATRAEILKKLVNIGYLQLNKKTQVVTPQLQGEMVYDVVNSSIRPLLNPELTASWEKGLTGVADGTISTEVYMQKLEAFIRRRTDVVKGLNNQMYLRQFFDAAAQYYSPSQRKAAGKRSTSTRTGTSGKRTRGKTGSAKNTAAKKSGT